MRLHDLKPRPGAKHRKKRLGRGESSGLGKTSGKGHKGQKARSGASIRPGFEGGQMPLNRRLPNNGFVLNVDDLNDRFEDGATVNEATLREAGLVRGVFDGIKILGDGELQRKLTVEVSKLSATAKEKIEKAGGTVVSNA